MPIQIDELETQVDVRGAGAPTEPERQQPPADALPRWQQLQRRNDELAARTCASDFDD